MTPRLPPGPYQLIMSDPPWQYRDACNAGKRGAQHKYPVMTLRQICRLDVEAIAAPDCVLAMWWVPPMPTEALKVIDAWGFRLVNMKGFTWVKRHAVTGKRSFGMGHWTRANSEDCLIAVRGRPKRASGSVSQLVEAPLRGHSQKPDEVRDALVALCGDVPRLEMFARTRTPGWDVWGNQA